MKAKIITILACLCLSLHAQKYEVRAVWLTTIGGIDWPHSANANRQRQELCQILDQLKMANVNTVLLQTRVRASTIYPSDIEPFDLCLTGTHGMHPGYDPLQFAIDECHKRGMELHAWIVTIPIGKTGEARFKEFKRRHPELAMNIGQEGYMNPEKPATGDYLARICAEVTRRYDIDGIHLDYIRYPETWPKGGGTAKAANTRNRRAKSKIAATATPAPRTTAYEKRANITAIVRKIYQAVKSQKPWVKLSCSPIGKAGDLSRYRSGGWNAYHAVYQDAQGWLREGLMDQLYPMMYFRGNNFYPFALDWQERSYGRTIVSGLGIYFLSPREGNWPLVDVTREMHFLRRNGIGHCYFRSKFLTDNTKGIYDFVRQFDNAPALIPPMTWTWSQKPGAPTQLSVERQATADRLAWSGATDRSGAPYLLYNVYASTVPYVDTSEPRNLVATRVMGNSITLPHSNGCMLYYAVTAIDRYGNESQVPGQGIRGNALSSDMSLTSNNSLIPSGTNSPLISYTSALPPVLLRSDGKRLKLPKKPSVLDADYMAIETMQGQLLMTVPYHNDYANVSRLPDGIYQLRSIGRKGVSHRMGLFTIKRQTQ